jgi:hypothetical protein
MRRVKFGVLALCALAAVFSAIAASASAETLAEFTVETAASSPKQSVTSTFETPSAFEGKLVSSELSSTQEPENKKEGKLHIMFYNVKCENPLLGSATAESLGDEAGIVLVEGKYSVVDSNLILLTINKTHIECLYGVTILLTVEGTLLGTLSPTGSKTKSFSLTVKGKKGTQEPSSYKNNAGTSITPELKTSKNEESPAKSSQNESKAVSLETTLATELT